MNNLEDKTPQKSKVKMVLMALGVLFIASNLRAPLTSVGPVIAELSTTLGLSNVWAGMVTTIPLIAFATLSGFAPKVSRKYGMELVLLAALIILALGLGVRQWGTISTLFIGAALVGIAITMGNVLMPAYIKNSFPKQVGLMMGLYSVAMNLTAALAAGFSIQLGNWTGMGWRGSIGIWFFLALFTLVIWLPQVKRKKFETQGGHTSNQEPKVNLYRSKLAWAVTLFMGLQSFLFYCVAAWFPKVMQSWGMTPEDSGWVLSYVQFAQLPISFVGAIIASKMNNQKFLAVLSGLLFGIGIIGIIVFKTEYIILWSICIGTASGLAFSLSMLFFVLRSHHSTQAAELSGMAQAFGYLIAACGPPLFGAIYDSTGNWMAALWMLVGISIILLIAGFVAGRDELL